MTALIKMWHFLEGISSPSAEKKKVKQKLVPYTQQDVMSFRRRFTTFDGNKKVMQEPLPYMGENVSTPSFLLPIMEVKNMLIRNVQVAHNFFTIFLYN